MNETLPVIECGRCGQLAYVAADGTIACYCLPGMSAAEHHAADAERRLERAS